MRFEELKTLLFARSNFGMKLGLERMREACALLGDPQLAAPVLHVAGTNGKGSTCAFTEASLRAAGLRTGLYTSPHLNHFCERIQLDGAPISEERACSLLEEIVARVPWALGDAGGHREGLTFFEIVTLMAFAAFRGVEVMVVEVGLGGRLDATNVVSPLACAVTPLGLEHTQYLGPTLAHIAFEKAGIFKAGAPAVSAGQPVAAARVLEERARAAGTSLWRPGRDYRFESRDVRPFCYQGPRWTVRAGDLALPGHHQRTNGALACALLEAAAQKGLPVRPEHAEAGLRTARWPARLERFGNVLVDGAHNPHAVAALVRALAALDTGEIHLVFGALQDKDVPAMLRELTPLCASMHFCAPDSPRALQPEALLALAQQVDPPHVRAEREATALAAPEREPGRGVPEAGARQRGSVSSRGPAAALVAHGSVREALDAARAAANTGTVLCCGSLYLAAEIRALLTGQPAASMPGERL